MLLDLGLDPNAPPKNADPPLVTAAKHGYDEIFSDLLEFGANINGGSVYTRTPLSYLVLRGRCVMVRLLLVRGANVNAVDADDCTTLHSAVKCALASSHLISRELLERGADPNAADADGNTALHFLARYTRKHSQHTSIIQELVKKGANVLSRNSRLESPVFSALSTAVNKGNTPFARFPIQHGADPDRQRADGKSLRTFVKEYKKSNVGPNRTSRGRIKIPSHMKVLFKDVKPVESGTCDTASGNVTDMHQCTTIA
ncbi:hypothetical protein N7532_011682 [Penicillium argentinense]|uniref:Ankyrin repeat protein n=1 Tax=Penicillium argentinense TaxID=1131581 RepID=A0A9W9EIZ0_9EURO|nr:uncharacterized protein N7532_011682 [Penicillium argentinense]KAJ5082639.1 hypothetical protein N7532_011682 [Penicillium argentinense]